MPRKPTTDAIEIIHNRLYAGNPHRLEALAKAIAKDDTANQIRHLRTQAGLTQAQLSKLVGSHPSTISRLETATYESHPTAVLQRILIALRPPSHPPN